MDCALKLGGTAGWAPLLSRVVGWSLWLNAAVSWPCGWLPRIIVQASWLNGAKAMLNSWAGLLTWLSAQVGL